jgi:tRNA1(Val) A37 N6-methylase TrmN6
VSDDELTSDAITASFRVVQRRRGHRFSLDDLATAWVAGRARPGARAALDLGCGVGSVLLMVAYVAREARLYGVEAQAESFALATRNVRENGLSARVALCHGDLREAVGAFPPEPCDLVTGTPPYLPPGSAVPSPDPQRAAARIELRGGIEDYLAAAARVLAPDGLVVACADGRAPERVLRGARAAGLAARERLDVIPREGAPSPLFSVWTLAREAAGEPVPSRVVMRDRQGLRTDDARAMRALFGLDAGP